MLYFYVEPIQIGVGRIPSIVAKDALDSPTIPNISFNLEHLVDVTTLLGLACLGPLLSVIKNLIKLAQAWDMIFFIDLVQTIKLNQGELNEMFLDPSTTLRSYPFHFF